MKNGKKHQHRQRPLLSLVQPLEHRSYLSSIALAAPAGHYPVTDAHPAVAVSHVDPSAGSTAGGTSVTITGTDFTSASQVSFGTVAAVSVTVNSATSITAVTPTEGAGEVDVLVTTTVGSSAASSVDRFTFVTPSTLPAPVAVSPGTSASPGAAITTLTPTLSWQAITGVTFTGYQINLYNQTTKAFVSYTTGVSATSFMIPGNSALSAGDIYVWNVRALNGAHSGPPSNYLFFHTPPASTTLPAPVAASPGNSVSPGPALTTLTPTFEWHAISGVNFTGYQINLANLTTNTSVSYTTEASITSFTVPTSAPLVAGDNYVWNVRALNGAQSGPPSNYLYFQAPLATVTLPAPVAVSPGSATSPGPVITTLNPTLEWHAISGVTFTGYQVNLYDVTTGSSVTYTTGASVNHFTVPTSAPLTAGNTYVWNVRALNGTQSGPPSNYLYFQAPPATVTLPAPVAISPGSSSSPGPVITTLTPTFTWQGISGVTFTGYQISLYDVTTKTSATYTAGTGDTGFTVPTSAPLVAGNAYVWNVRALNGTQSGPPSNYLYFQSPPSTVTTLPAPVAYSPGSDGSPGTLITTLAPTFTWQAISGVTFTGYQINLYNATTATSVSYTTDTSVTSFTVSSTAALAAGDSYTWNVRALNGTVSGPPSNYLTFQTPPASTTALPAPTAVSPGISAAPGPVLTTLNPTFIWQAVTGVKFTGYQINLYDTTTSALVGFTVGVGDTHFTVPSTSPLLAGNSYVWNVRVLNGTQSGPPSVYLYFQTPPATITSLPAPTSIAPGNTATPGQLLTTLDPAFSWDAISGVSFTGYQIYIHDFTADSTLSYQAGVSDVSFTPVTPLAPGHLFVWSVRAVNGTQSGPPSTYLYFQTAPPTSPPAGSTISVQPETVKTTLPAAVAFGGTFHGKSVVDVTNNTSGLFKGSVMTQLYASVNGVIDDSSILIGSLTKMLNLKVGRSVNVVVPIKSLPVGLDGTYCVLARTTDYTGATADSSYGPTFQVAAPFVALSAAFAPLTASAMNSGAIITLTNYGNKDEVTSLAYSLGFSGDAAGLFPVGSSLGTGTIHRVRIKAGKSIKIHLRGWKVPGYSLPPGNFFLTALLTDHTGISTTAVSSTSVPKT